MKKHLGKHSTINSTKPTNKPVNNPNISKLDSKISFSETLSLENLKKITLLKLQRNSLTLVIIAAITAFIIKVLLASQTMGTNDIFYWKMFLDVANNYGGIVLYQQLSWWNHPPMMIHILYIIGLLESTFGISFNFLLRFFPILADIGSLVIVYKILKSTNNFSLPKLLLLALAPTSIMISGFHGNTDPIMIFFVLLSVYLIDIDNETLSKLLPGSVYEILLSNDIGNYHLAGIAMALAVNVKIVPVILAPCIFFYLPTNKRRLEYILSATIIWFFTSLPYIFQEPVQILRSIFGYGSFYGNWGISRILLWCFPFNHWLNDFFYNKGKFLVIAIVIIASIWMNLGNKKPHLFLQVSFIFFLFMSLSPGFGVQYLVWLTPWIVSLGLGATGIFFLTSGLFLFLVYNWWAAGLPWDVASADVGVWGGVVVHYELLCWFSIIALTFIFFSYLVSEKNSAINAYLAVLRQKNIFVVPVIIFVLFIGAKAFSDLVVKYGSHLYGVQGENHQVRQKKVLEITYVGMSSIYFRNGFYKECIESCNQTLALNPHSADAYNNICVSYIKLKEWDKAIEAGNKALQIKPDYPLIKNNIAWAQNQKSANP